VKPVVQLTAPWHLTNWSLPVVEAVMVGGVIYALVHAVRRWRRVGDPTVFALWCASVIYLLLMEPPIYFPNVFGIQKQIDVPFVHNIFTVQFLYGRLPLYIVALYPAMAVLAYEIVRSLGVFQRRGTLVGAVCVGFVHHCFYEVFDQLGPQLRWWLWNPDVKALRPAIASVPMVSITMFATFGPFILTVLIRWLIAGKADRCEHVGGWSLGWRIVAAGALVPLGDVISGIPSSLFGGGHPNTTAQAAIMGIELAIFAVVGAAGLLEGWHRTRSGADHLYEHSTYALFHGTAYLTVFAFLWATALPAWFAATNGVTTGGTLTGSLPYAALSFAGAAAAVALSATAGRPVPRSADLPKSPRTPVTAS
jgi:hypothetical protein